MAGFGKILVHLRQSVNKRHKKGDKRCNRIGKFYLAYGNQLNKQKGQRNSAIDPEEKSNYNQCPISTRVNNALSEQCGYHIRSKQDTIPTLSAITV